MVNTLIEPCASHFMSVYILKKRFHVTVCMYCRPTTANVLVTLYLHVLAQCTVSLCKCINFYHVTCWMSLSSDSWQSAFTLGVYARYYSRIILYARDYSRIHFICTWLFQNNFIYTWLFQNTLHMYVTIPEYIAYARDYSIIHCICTWQFQNTFHIYVTDISKDSTYYI